MMKMKSEKTVSPSELRPILMFMVKIHIFMMKSKSLGCGNCILIAGGEQKIIIMIIIIIILGDSQFQSYHYHDY